MYSAAKIWWENQIIFILLRTSFTDEISTVLLICPSCRRCSTHRHLYHAGICITQTSWQWASLSCGLFNNSYISKRALFFTSHLYDCLPKQEGVAGYRSQPVTSFEHGAVPVTAYFLHLCPSSIPENAFFFFFFLISTYDMKFKRTLCLSDRQK